MNWIKRYGTNWNITYALLSGLILIISGGCQTRDKIFTIGIVNMSFFQDMVFEGFKKGMSDLGYIEGKDVRYIYEDKLGNEEKNIDKAIQALLAKDVDLLVTTSNETALRARKAVQGKNAPVLAIACANPVKIGLAGSVSSPGGNITGIQVVDSVSKGLEWFIKILPHAKKIYLPYNPEDTVSISYLDSLNRTASQLGVELVCQKVKSGEEAVIAIENLPEDIDAIYRIPSPSLGLKNEEINQASIKRKIPLGSGSGINLSKTVTSFASDNFDMGRQAARLANQIRNGIKPADLPFETSDPYLTINLQLAEKLGLQIPEDILAQAKNIIR